MKFKQTYIWLKTTGDSEALIEVTRLGAICSTSLGDDKHYAQVAADIAVDEVQRLRVNGYAIPEGNGVEGDDYTVTVEWDASE